MTRAEVHAILGGPPGVYWTRPTTIIPRLSTWWDSLPAKELDKDDGKVIVHFDSPSAGNEVVRLRFHPAFPREPGFLELPWSLGKWLP